MEYGPTSHNEAVELIVFGAWVFPPAGSCNFAADLLPASPLRPPLANLPALRQYSRYAFTYITRHAI
jgi:hypothetical protein